MNIYRLMLVSENQVFKNNTKVFYSSKINMQITEDRVGGVPGNLVLGGITNHAFHRSECNIRRRRSVSLIIHYYLYSFMLPHCHARVRCTQIYPNRWAFSLVRHCRPKRKVSKTQFQMAAIRLLCFFKRSFRVRATQFFNKHNV